MRVAAVDVISFKIDLRIFVIELNIHTISAFYICVYAYSVYV